MRNLGDDERVAKKKFLGFNGILIRDLCNTGGVL